MRSLFVLSTIFLFFSVFVAICVKNFAEVTCLRDATTSNLSHRRRPKYLFHIPEPSQAPLSLIDNVLTSLGLEKIPTENLTPSAFPLDWDLFWSHDHHVKLNKEINFRATKFNQKMNHFPGNFVLVSKSILATRQPHFPFIPRAFLTSQATQEYARLHPEKRFVIKRKSNRGVRLMQAFEMNFTETSSTNDFFAQEYVERPLLWHGHKFDLGVYVAITSVNPLRLYYFTREVSLRFCPKPYNITNADDTDSYVIGNGNLSAQKFKGTSVFVNAGYTFKDAFEAFLVEKRAKPEEIWRKVEDLIVQVMLPKEKIMVKETASFGTSKFSHFELVRFDMIFNEDLELFLLEVNMGPNMQASPTISLFKYSFENILFNLFNLVGVGTSFEASHFVFPNADVEKMVVHSESLTVKPEVCMTPRCKDSCMDKSCKICWKCLTINQKYDRIQAYREQLNAGEFKRIFPPNRERFEQLPQELVKELMPESITHAEWYFEMCKKNRNFC